MHYYKRNLGDYAKKAGRLSMLQHGAYTLLIDACYDREQFPTHSEALEWTWASSTAEVEAVEFVLAKFFELVEDGCYVQWRISEELQNYQANAVTNKRIAIDRETNRKEKGTNRANTTDEALTKRQRVEHEPPPNHKPLTNNQEPITKEKKAQAPDNFVLPDWINQKHWDAWHSNPKRKKATPAQKQLSVDKLDKWRQADSDFAGALENAAVGGYQGLFLPDAKKAGKFTDDPFGLRTAL